jgi:16S rRNA (guanine966-N2)-methyltransferase
LFDMLLHAPWGGSLAGVNVLDGFAGTGALGLEALSRGAASAWFIEKDRAALAALRANVAACGAGVVLAADILRPPPGQPCGLVFLDPPYGHGLLPRALSALRCAGWLAPDATIVAETAADETPELGVLRAERRHGAGRVTIWSVADHV